MPVTAAQPLFHHQFPPSQKLPRINSPASGLRPERTINPELEAAFAFGLSIGRIIGADLVAEGGFAYA